MLCEYCGGRSGITNSMHIKADDDDAEGMWVCGQCETELTNIATCPCGCEEQGHRCVYEQGES